MASDPIPEDELPPRLRFERIVKGAEPHVFESVRPQEDPPSAEPAEPGSDASILERFEALKRSLSGEIAPASPAPLPREPDEPPADQQPIEPSADHASVEESAEETPPEPAHGLRTIDELQARIREVKRREEERSSSFPGSPLPGEMAPGRSDGAEEEPVAPAALSRKEQRRRRRKTRSFWQELPILILVALVVAVIIKTFFFQAFYIPSGSMIPTLQINDRVLVNKLSYRFGAIERSDILVFDSPEAIDVERSLIQRVFRSIGEATGITSPDTVLIKRVIGLPGESVKVQDNQVYVNGNPIAEPYLPEGTIMRDFDEIVVPADSVFMMGDNRNQSRDSRVFGPIPREDIVGRAFVKVWPPGAWSGL
jgi:signal peptidase I